MATVSNVYKSLLQRHLHELKKCPVEGCDSKQWRGDLAEECQKCRDCARVRQMECGLQQLLIDSNLAQFQLQLAQRGCMSVPQLKCLTRRNCLAVFGRRHWKRAWQLIGPGEVAVMGFGLGLPCTAPHHCISRQLTLRRRLCDIAHVSACGKLYLSCCFRCR